MENTYYEQLRRLKGEIAGLVRCVLQAEERDAAWIEKVGPSQAPSARNFAHYLGMRRLDLRKLQLELTHYGLSSLGRSEGHVLGTLVEINRRLNEALAVAGEKHEPLGPAHAVDFEESQRRLHENTRALFGEKPQDRHVYILLTCPDLPEITTEWLDAMLEAGVDAFRLNLAHGTIADWRKSIERIRARSAAAGRDCRIFVDLPGPKLRTGRFPEGPRFQKWKVKRDRLGRLAGPAHIPLAEGDPSLGLTLPASWLPRLKEGDRLRVTDTRGRALELFIHEKSAGEWEATGEKTLNVLEGGRVEHWRGGQILTEGAIGPLAALPESLALAPNDTLLLVEEDRVASLAVHDASGALVAPATVACPVRGWLSAIRCGERVLFDDGKIEAVVEEVQKSEARLRIVRTPEGAPARLRAGKGINFPETRLPLPGLTETDRAALEFACASADGVAVSFVRTAADVREIQRYLSSSPRPLGLILKIESQSGFRNLPEILFQGMQSHPLGVMIARGDLAVECGFERLAELQEEILWLCEAAHLPVIWATQVFESLAQRGLPTRAEVTDAAMSVRAECVMLNKGPHIEQAVRTLVEILRKMESHLYKKKALFRALCVASGAGREREGSVA